MKHKDPREKDEEAERKAEEARKLELVELRDVLGVQSGFNVVMRILRHCRFLESIWSPSAEIHRNAGRQEVGNWLFGEIVAASPDALTEIVNGIKRDQAEDVNKKAKGE